MATLRSPGADRYRAVSVARGRGASGKHGSFVPPGGRPRNTSGTHRVGDPTRAGLEQSGSTDRPMTGSIQGTEVRVVATSRERAPSSTRTVERALALLATVCTNDITSLAAAS